MGLFEKKRRDADLDQTISNILKMQSDVLATQNKLAKRQTELMNRVNNLAEEWIEFKASSLQGRMDNIEKVQTAQGATLEGYLKRIGSMHKDIIELYQTKISRPENAVALNFGAWMDDIENRLKAVESDGKQPEPVSTLFDNMDKACQEFGINTEKPAKRTRCRMPDKPIAYTWARRYDMPMCSFKNAMQLSGFEKGELHSWNEVRLTEEEAWKVVHTAYPTIKRWHK